MIPIIINYQQNNDDESRTHHKCISTDLIIILHLCANDETPVLQRNCLFDEITLTQLEPANLFNYIKRIFDK